MPPVLIAVIIIIGLFILCFILWSQFSLRKELTKSLAELHQEVNQHLQDSIKAMQSTYQTVGEHMADTSRMVSDVSGKLGELTVASERIFEVGKDISSLQEILQSPKLRGGFGELMLENLLGQMLPQKNYTLQYRFKSGEIVDAVIRINRLVAVDAKFPLENFKRLWKLDEKEKASTLKQFMRDVKKHIDAIAEKYIRPDEGTYDFALMYIPAENVYYEIVLKEETGGDQETLNDYALKQRVFPVSPNTFYTHLTIIVQGLKGMQIEQRAGEIIDLLAKIHQDFTRFRKEFDNLGKNIRWAYQNYESAGRHLDKLDDKLANIEKPGEQLPIPKVKSKSA